MTYKKVDRGSEILPQTKARVFLFLAREPVTNPHRARKARQTEPIASQSANSQDMRITSLKLESVKDLLIAELRDLHNAEEQLVEALPKMAEAASSTELRNAFNHHLDETRKHVTRLDDAFKNLGEKASGETCEAMKGLVKEGEEFIKAKGQPDVRDAGLIGAAQRVEHYEMAGYGTARTLARRLGLNDIAETLQKTLEEERAADEKLTAVAESDVNLTAARVAAK
jgi:ferritin-like metal-binding protein YciE